MPASLDLPLSVDAELAALRRLLDFGEGSFSSSIAICNSPVERDRLIERIRETHPGVAVVAIPARTVDVFGYVIEDYTAPPKALFLIGLEASVTSQEADSHTLRSLNASRDLWPNRYPCPIVLWLPEYAATALSQQARDYWRFISHRFYFAPEYAMQTPRASDTYDAKYLNAISLSRDEKVARIEELQSRIGSVGDDPPPSLQKYVMDWWDELALLHKFTGNLEEPLRIHREEQLPVYERLGDEREKAVTLGKIADILQQRGQTDEALRIRREDELPVYERLGDVHAKAVTMGQIADILHQRGQTDEAFRNLETIKVIFHNLGDVRAKAVTMGRIADILQERGQTEEALRIHREEELPVYQRLGDMREQAVAMGRIADILQQRGQTDEALRIRREDELPIYERLGDVQSKAVTMGRIADILVSRGDIHEAIRSYREILTELEGLGDLYLMIRCRTQLAIALSKRGYKKDVPIIREHLLWALAEAEKRHYVPEAEHLRQIVNGLPIQ